MGPVSWMMRSILAFLDRSNIFVALVIGSCVLYKRSAGVAYFTLGACACSVTVQLVKRVIRQPRPPAEKVIGRKIKKTYGMPSTHSAVVAFDATYVLLACLYLPIHPSTHLDDSTRLYPLLVVFPSSLAIMMSRVWLGHHTWPQVAAGTSYGVVFATFCYALWTKGLNEHGDKIEQLVNSYLHEVFGRNNPSKTGSL